MNQRYRRVWRLLACNALALGSACLAQAQPPPGEAGTAPSASGSKAAYLPLQSALRDRAWEAARRPAVFVQRAGEGAMKAAGGATRAAPRRLIMLEGEGVLSVRLNFSASHADKPVRVVLAGGGALGRDARKDTGVAADGTYTFTYQPPTGAGRFPVIVELEGVRTALHFVRP